MGYLYLLYPQNGDRIVTNDFVTSFHPVYNDEVLATSCSVASISRRRRRRLLLLLLLLERERISVRRRHASRLSLAASEAPLARRHQDAGGWVGSARCQSNQRTPSPVVNAAASAPAAAAAAAAAALNRGSLPPPGREWILSGRRSLASSDGPTVCLQLRVIGVRRSDDFHRCCGHHHDKK